MTSVCKPEAVQALWKPVCTMGQVLSALEPLFGGWALIHTYKSPHELPCTCQATAGLCRAEAGVQEAVGCPHAVSSKQKDAACLELVILVVHVMTILIWCLIMRLTLRSEQALVKLAVPRKASTAVSWLQASRALVSSAACQNSLQLARPYMLMPASSASRTASGLRMAALRRLPALGRSLPASFSCPRTHLDMCMDM